MMSANVFPGYGHGGWFSHVGFLSGIRATLLVVCGLGAAANVAGAAEFPSLAGPVEKAPKLLLGQPLMLEETFESALADRWEMTDSAAWKVTRQGQNSVLSQFRASKYKPKFRSPFNRALLRTAPVASFVLDARVQSTTRDYPHRDVCLFFGFQDESHLYYVHFGKRADPHANQIFIVNGDARKMISTKTTTGTPWNDEWHHVRIVRDSSSGKIDVYFDDMKTPAMTAVDKTFISGRVGVGTFDDTANFDHVRLYGQPRIEKKSR